MKISFDFDSCLAEDRQQKLASKFINDGHDVYITTSRFSDGSFSHTNNRSVYYVANKLGIPNSNITFTNGIDKWEFLGGFDIHFDDDQIEIELIEENLSNCVGVLILDP